MSLEGQMMRDLKRYLPPWGIEFDEKVLMLLELIIEGVIGQNENTLVGLDSGDGAHHI
jgi:hypothetical protein